MAYFQLVIFNLFIVACFLVTPGHTAGECYTKYTNTTINTKENCTATNYTCYTKVTYANGSNDGVVNERKCKAANLCTDKKCNLNDKTSVCEYCCNENLCNKKNNFKKDDNTSDAIARTGSVAAVLFTIIHVLITAFFN